MCWKRSYSPDRSHFILYMSWLPISGECSLPTAECLLTLVMNGVDASTPLWVITACAVIRFRVITAAKTATESQLIGLDVHHCLLLSSPVTSFKLKIVSQKHLELQKANS